MIEKSGRSTETILTLHTYLQRNPISNTTKMKKTCDLVKPFCKKRKILEQLLAGPTPRLPASYFAKYGILTPQFKVESSKFLRPTVAIFKNCLELKNRALFGSVVNADVVSYLVKHPSSTAYQVAKATHHHKARVFEIYEDVLAAS